MVDSLRQSYTHVLSLVQLHLLQEYPAGQWLDSSAEVCEFFRKRLQPVTKPVKPSSAPTLKQTPPPAPQPIPKPIAVVEKREPAKQPTQTIPTPIAAPPKVEAAKHPFSLSPPSTKPRDTMDDWKRLLGDIAPTFALLDNVPAENDLLNEHIQNAKVWIVLGASPSPAERVLLEDLARALALHDFPTCFLRPQQLRQDLAMPLLVLSNTPLPTFIKALSLALPSLTELMNSPEQKASLWKSISSSL